jgi:hypothetical protein
MSPGRPDLAAVTQLHADYARHVDSHDGVAFADLFGDGGVLDFAGREITGRDALAAFVARAPNGVHLPGVPSIQPAPDGGVAAVSAFVFVNAATGQLVAGRYTDRLVWQDDRLVFARRHIDVQARVGSAGQVMS